MSRGEALGVGGGKGDVLRSSSAVSLVCCLRMPVCEMTEPGRRVVARSSKRQDKMAPTGLRDLLSGSWPAFVAGCVGRTEMTAARLLLLRVEYPDKATSTKTANVVTVDSIFSVS